MKQTGCLMELREIIQLEMRFTRESDLRNGYKHDAQKTVAKSVPTMGVLPSGRVKSLLPTTSHT